MPLPPWKSLQETAARRRPLGYDRRVGFWVMPLFTNITSPRFRSGDDLGCPGVVGVLRALALGLLLTGWAGACGAAPVLVDTFANRQLLTDPSGQLDGSNVGATIEPGEPLHGGKPGGASVWISWEAQTDGLATFWTDGSTFDTLLSAYSFGQPADTTLDKLRLEGRNDDDPTRVPAQTSLIQFGARAGTRYQIAVDGYRGATGNIRLRWDFIAATSPPPIIVSIPEDRAARQGDAVTMTVDLITTPEVRLQWRFNGASFGAQGPTLFIPSLQPANVGHYTLRIDLGDVRFETAPVELQINSDGQTNALARDKLFDAFASALTPEDGGAGGGVGGAALRAASASFQAAATGVTRGYNGTQIFNTTLATPDPSEPQHCGLAGGATYWYAYQPPADGTLTLDTIGSTYDTFLAVYTYNPPFNSYQDLIPIACDNDSAGTNGAARLEFAAPKSRQFLVVVDGINGARGIAHLNYQLDTNRPPVPPTLVQSPLARTVAAGDTVVLHPEVSGSPPLHYSWRKGTNVLLGATNSDLRLSNVAPPHSGDYSVVVSSHVGLPLAVLVPLRVVVPPRLQSLADPVDGLRFSFPSVAGQQYFLEHAEGPGGPWQPMTNSFFGDGSEIVVTNGFTGGTGFYRLRVE